MGGLVNPVGDGKAAFRAGVARFGGFLVVPARGAGFALFDYFEVYVFGEEDSGESVSFEEKDGVSFRVISGFAIDMVGGLDGNAIFPNLFDIGFNV